MNSKFFLIAVLLFVVQLSVAQKSTFLGFEGGRSYDQYIVHDPTDIITNTKLESTFFGVTLSQELSENFLIETGIIRKGYYQGYEETSSPGGQSYSTAYNTWQIPIRLKGRLPIVKEKFYLTTTVGYHYGINSNYGSGGTGGSHWSNDSGDTLSITSTSNNTITERFSLLETGVGLELYAFKGVLLYASSSYYTGLNDIYKVNYSIYNGLVSTDDAVAVSRGSYWNITFGVKFAISNLWIKRE